MNAKTTFDKLIKRTLAFRDERDWEQFHTIQNLITSINLESAELLELTQWKTHQQIEALANSDAGRENLSDECADILIYLILLADQAGIDLLNAAHAKISKNEVRYPKVKSRGNALKYREL